jgi:hypothetical protein
MANLGSESETCVGSRVRLVGVSISFEKNFSRLPFTPPISGSSYRSFNMHQWWPVLLLCSHADRGCLLPARRGRPRSDHRASPHTTAPPHSSIFDPDARSAAGLCKGVLDLVDPALSPVQRARGRASLPSPLTQEREGQRSRRWKRERGRALEPLFCSEGRIPQEWATEEGLPQIAASSVASAGAYTVALRSAFRGCSSCCRSRWRRS